MSKYACRGRRPRRPTGKCGAFFGIRTELPLRGRVVEDADPYGCMLRYSVMPHSGSASNTFSPPFQGKLIRQENSFGSFVSSRLPYL